MKSNFYFSTKSSSKKHAEKIVEKKEQPEDIEDQVSKLGERLNDIMRRFTVMPK